MFKFISHKEAMAAKAVVMVQWSPSSRGKEWVMASIDTFIHPGEPTETECEIENIATNESMTRQGMKERAEGIARSRGISNICLRQVLASDQLGQTKHVDC